MLKPKTLITQDLAGLDEEEALYLIAAIADDIPSEDGK